MAEIASFGVDVDKNTKLAQNAQDTADEAGAGIGDLNDPNKLAPAEKATLKRKYDTDVLLYGMDTKKLTDNHLSTSEIDSAMSALTAYMTPLFSDMTTTDTIDRDTLNTVYKNFDTADKDSDSAFTNMVSSAASDAMVAGNQASVAGSEAVVAGNQASEAASNASVQASVAVSNANVANSNATSGITIARSAANDMAVVSEAVTALKGGSTLTMEQLENGLRTKITAGDLNVNTRNLLCNTAFSTDISDWSANTAGTQTPSLDITHKYNGNNSLLITATGAGNGNLGTIMQAFLGAYKSGDPLSLSFWAMNPDNTTVLLHTELNGGLGAKQLTVTSNWQYFTVNLAYSDAAILYFWLMGAGRVLINSPMLVASNIAASWQQAPEDFSQLVETKTASLAETMVKNSDFTTYKDQTATAISTEINKAVSPNIVPEDGWRTSPDGAGNPSTITTHPFYTGSQPLYELDNNSTVENYAYSPRFSLKPNTTYVLSFKGFEDVHVSSMDMFVLARKKGETSSYSSAYQVVSGKVLSPSTAEYVTTISFTTETDINSGYIRIDNNGSKDGVNGDLYFTEVQMQEGSVATPYQTPTNDLVSSKIIQTIDNYSVGFQNPDGSKFQMNLSADGTALMDFSKIMLNGATNIQDATISTAKIADAAITNAKIGKLAVGTAQIADLAVTSAKVAEIDAGLIKSGTIDTNRLNADAIIANVINGKTINGITINTPTLNLGLNGTFNETYDYTQDTGWFLPKKASGSVTFNHGVIEDQGTMQSYVNGTWGGMNDSSVFTSGLTNNVWTEYAPGYYKIDMYKQGSTSNVLQRTYADPTGYYYTDAAGDYTYLGNILTTSQVQAPSIFATVLNLTPKQLLMKIVSNGSDWGLEVGSYAGKEAVLSDFIYNSTSSNSANLYTTANGHIVRSTSASKYKYNIKHAIDEDSLADKLLTMHVSTWNDKHAVDSYAQTLTDNTASEDISIKDNYGLIAEDLRDAGLDMFVEYGKNHTIEGIEYDRAWLPLLPKMRQMNDKINEYELRISKLEAKINE